jgi:hypothetical protein
MLGPVFVLKSYKLESFDGYDSWRLDQSGKNFPENCQNRLDASIIIANFRPVPPHGGMHPKKRGGSSIG